MVEKSANTAAVKELNLGMHDAVTNGEVMTDIPTRLIFCASSTERDAIKTILPGQFVATYGLGNIWQRKGDGTWATVK